MKKLITTGAFMLFSLPLMAADLGAGQDVFAKNCQSCHGADGAGVLPQAPKFNTGERLEKPDTELMASVKNGKGVMPAMGSMLSEEQMLDAIAYIRTLHQ